MKIDRAVIEVCGSCNYSCAMCPQARETGGRDRRFKKNMPLDEFERNVKDCAQHGLRIINLEGSGEPTTKQNLPEYIRIARRYVDQVVIFTNGYRMRGQFMRDCIDAGLTFCRFSMIGYDSASYQKWMNNHIGGSLFKVINNLKETQAYVEESESDCVVGTYHLILEPENEEAEIEAYKRIVEDAGVKTEIWKMHNWSGVYDPDYARDGKVKTCGRPFSPDVVIRAGGLDGETGAVAPCCQVLGRDEEAVLGHTSENTIEEIVNGAEYEALREGHRTGNYPDYCKCCDFLIDDPEVLCYTNHSRDLYKMYGTDFDLNDYR